MISSDPTAAPIGALASYINLKLGLLGFQQLTGVDAGEFGDLASSFVAQYLEKERLLATHLCPPTSTSNGE